MRAALDASAKRWGQSPCRNRLLRQTPHGRHGFLRAGGRAACAALGEKFPSACCVFRGGSLHSESETCSQSSAFDHGCCVPTSPSAAEACLRLQAWGLARSAFETSRCTGFALRASRMQDWDLSSRRLFAPHTCANAYFCQPCCHAPQHCCRRTSDRTRAWHKVMPVHGAGLSVSREASVASQQNIPPNSMSPKITRFTRNPGGREKCGPATGGGRQPARSPEKCIPGQGRRKQTRKNRFRYVPKPGLALVQNFWRATSETYRRVWLTNLLAAFDAHAQPQAHAANGYGTVLWVAERRVAC